MLTSSCLFFSNDPPTTEIYTLSLHDALPISCAAHRHLDGADGCDRRAPGVWLFRRPVRLCAQLFAVNPSVAPDSSRSEECMSELQSQTNLVCRLLLEKKKKNILTSIKHPTNR